MKWNATKPDFMLMARIARRAESTLQVDYRTTLMDLNATHANGNPLYLPGLLAAEMLDFSHDITGIATHIDRTTGKLGDGFTPRYSLCFHKPAEPAETERFCDDVRCVLPANHKGRCQTEVAE